MPILHALNSARIPVLAVFMLGFAAVAGAQDEAGERDDDFRPRLEVTPFAGYRTGGKFEFDAPGTSRTLNIQDDSSWGLDVGLYRDYASFYELLYSQQNAQIDTRSTQVGSLQLRTEYAHFGGTLLFPQDNNWFVPYLSMTIGATKFDPRDKQYRSETDFSLSLGGGMRLPFNEHAAAVLGVRGYLTFVDANTQIFCVSNGGGGCLFRISGDAFMQFEAQLGFAFTF
ncbi:MAG: hypothetical protein ABI616_09770 [Pseudomonadota bacterium]